MKVSLNSIRSIISSSNPELKLDIDTGELLDRIESNLGAIEATDKYGDKYALAVIVEVKEVLNHEAADKLKLCLINDNNKINNVARNDQGLVEVVCGAENVRAGLKTVWLPPDSLLPEDQSVKITSRDIRGKLSHGMLASAKELAIGDDHSGIVEVEQDKPVGQSFADAYNLTNDLILDLENKMFTHRPDCFGLLGIAREIVGINHLKFVSPDWYLNPRSISSSGQLTLNVINEIPDLTPRFCALPMTDITIGPSSLSMQIELSKAGIRSVNNIVDITNYLMILTAQPLHAYDYDKLKQLSEGEPTIVIRNPKDKERLKLLNGKEIEPSQNSIIIATDKTAIGLGGIMGGSETEVSPATKNIVLECASFDMYTIRKTSMKYGLFTDAVTRFTKGQSYLQNPAVIWQAADYVSRLCGGKVASKLIDNNHLDKAILDRNSLYPDINITPSFINDRLGTRLSTSDITNLLTNVEFEMSNASDSLVIKAPFFRTDIELREDIVEEVGRLYGYDQIPQKLPDRPSSLSNKNAELVTKDNLRSKLKSLGSNEILSYSFISDKLLNAASEEPSSAIALANAISPDLKYYRLSLLPSLLEKVHPNIKAGFKEFSLFEIGSVHSAYTKDEEGLPKEDGRLALVVAGSRKQSTPAYYLAKNYLEQLLSQHLTYANLEKDKLPETAKIFDQNRAATIYSDNGQLIGVIGEFNARAVADLKLPDYSAGFELLTEDLGLFNKPLRYIPIPRFPYVKQDITLSEDQPVGYQVLTTALSKAIDSLKPKNSIYSLDPISIYSPEVGQSVHTSYRLSMASYDETLTDKSVNDLLDQAGKMLEQSIKAKRV